jgi:class 3 adenylate cyclase
MEAQELEDLLTEVTGDVGTTLATVPPVLEADDPDVDDIPGQGSTKWLKIPRVVAVVADLKNSTALGTDRHDTSTARVYKAAVEGSVKILNRFDADFIDIQGDGGFGLFWGDNCFERALCAGVTIRTFSATFVKKLEAKWAPGGGPETGFKVGIAVGRVLVKNLGTPRNQDEQEAVWAGKPVNYATKCAQVADRHTIVVAGSVWDYFRSNDFVAYSCSCKSTPSAALWSDLTIDRLGQDDEKYGRITQVGWCENCGPSFCAAIMNGKRKRGDIPEQLRAQLQSTQMREALAAKAQADRENRARLNGLGGQRR